jgi:sulfate adenylyltransferase
VPDDVTPRPDDSAATAIPQWTPSARELDDLDLLVSGCFSPPLPGFVDPAQVEYGAAAITLVVDATRADEAVSAGRLDLIDPEGAPLARLTLQGTWPAADGRVGLAGPVSRLARNAFGPFRRLYVAPATLHGARARDTLVAVAVTRPLTLEQLADIDNAARDLGRTVLLIACVGDGMPGGISGPALIRATQTAAGHLTSPSLVVAAAVADHGNADTNRWLLDSVCRAYASETLPLYDAGPGSTDDPSAEAGADAPSALSDLPADVAEIVHRDRPPRDRQGAVFFFTGLSGSGKSTLARALMDHILERGERTITSLDGDVVRHHLSKGLGFSRADRETNILRIGFVAAEISRHGGLAVCSPIAPFESTRAEVRRMVERAGGGFVLIHVATPLEECERRDRKGLYAKARAGLIPDFTGISSPYEEPVNALKVDTTDRDIAECVAEILAALTTEGWLRS